MRHRLPAIDWMRGLVMLLMATDHASEAFNGDRVVQDSALFGFGELTTGQFLHRWISHLCAPTFLFLAGTSLALSVHRKLARGDSEAAVDRDLLVRGLLVLSVDLLFINWFWAPGALLLQVMFAIGASMMLMVPLRRLPAPVLVTLGLAVLASAELLLPAQMGLPFDLADVANALLVGTGWIDTPLERIGIVDKLVVAYPVLPWLAMMLLGWGFGARLLGEPSRGDARDPSRWSPPRVLATWGCAALALFAVVRGADGYGNMRLTDTGGGWIEWLHVSKYPPSVSYAALELGIMALILAALFVRQERVGDAYGRRGLLLVLGQTAFFFYVAHIFVFEVAARALGLYGAGTLGTSTIAWLVALPPLYGLCLVYRRYKATHPHSLARYF